jgi:UDP-N-acetylmuramate--alanine ligase
METFRGVERRLQRYLGGVYDDYAHNPEKLRAMLATLAERHPGGVCAIWRPHGYGPLRKMLDALAEMFAETLRPQDRLVLLPVYDAGGTADRSIGSDALAARLDPESVVLVDGPDAAEKWCCEHIRDFDAFVTCGARDPGLPALAARLSKARADISGATMSAL